MNESNTGDRHATGVWQRTRELLSTAETFALLGVVALAVLIHGVLGGNNE